MISKRFLITFISALALLAGTVIMIQFAKGYRPSRQGIIQGTGLLAANSFPNGAQVYIDGELTTATDNTLNLEPGEYAVEIKKDGYTPWGKTVRIIQELVVQTNAMLFPSAPGLTPLTLTGAVNVTPSPDGQKLAFYVASASAETKNGLYVLDLSDNLLSLQRGARQIVQEAPGITLSDASLLWSPDSSQVLLSYDGHNVLLDPTRMNTLANLPDVTYRLKRMFSEWEEELYTRERIRLQKFPEKIQRIATASAKNVYFSPDEERVLYTATASATLPEGLIPPVPSVNTQPQTRTLEPGEMYVYDRKEDTNFRVGTEQELTKTQYAIAALATDLFSSKPKTLDASPAAFGNLQRTTTKETMSTFSLYYTGALAGSLQWFPDSKHVIGIEDGKIVVIEYDATNKTVIYAGPFDERFVYPWPNGSKLVILTNFNRSLGEAANLYAVTLK